jgi:hypothetical protein
MGPIKQYTAEKVDGPLTVWVHPGANGAFSWYEDDGTSFDFRKGQFMKVNMAWNDGQRRLTLRLANGAKMLAAAKHDIVIRVAGEQIRKAATFEGKPLDIKL